MINFLKRYFDKKRFMIGSSHILNMRKSYPNIETLSDVDYKIFSQNGEDGIIDYLLKSLKIERPNFVEIGIGDYSESNTRFLFERNACRGLIVDCLDDLKAKVSKNIKLWRGDLTVIESIVNTENILEILITNKFQKDVDFFSLDIDGVDYWILEKLPPNFSKIVVVEYNSVFGNKKKITVPNINKFYRTDYHHSNLCFGMSLPAAIEVMQNKNFYFVGVNLMKNNAFFVSNDFPKHKFFKNLQIEELNKIEESNFRESRDIDGNLNYLSGTKRIKEISGCEVINLDHDLITKMKIGEIYKINNNIK